MLCKVNEQMSSEWMPIHIDQLGESDSSFFQVIPVTSGVAHSVWEVKDEKGVYFLKKRGDHFTVLPQIEIDPTDVRHEHRALKLMEQLAPGFFPSVLYYDEENYSILMTDVVGDGEILENILNSGKMTPEMAFLLGKTLRTVHLLIKDAEAIREDDDAAFCELKLTHRFGLERGDKLEKVVSSLLDNRDQLILGDPSPKNIGSNAEGKFVFFDLEDVHKGNSLFDVGFLLGHLILHTLQDPEIAERIARGFLDGYGFDKDPAILKTIVMGTILYRLNGIIPYNCSLPDEIKECTIQGAEALLADGKDTDYSWQELIAKIKGGK